MIEVKRANEVDEANYPSENAIGRACDRADLMKLESDILRSIAKKLNISIPNGQHCELDYLADMSNEMTDLFAGCGPLFNGCLVNSYSNSIQFCGAICDSLDKLRDNFVKQSERPYSFESLKNNNFFQQNPLAIIPNFTILLLSNNKRQRKTGMETMKFLSTKSTKSIAVQSKISTNTCSPFIAWPKSLN